ncbi:APC membrane recruitment protein 1 [Amia ocellicauda]|uniref:APC membrane recruitment protein 1 n=1 Tax=Amia ocellicauda TaxID=2972642 RepID=UPI003464D9CA
MEPGRGSEQTAGTKPLSGGCEEAARGGPALELEADQPSESAESAPPEQQQQPPGKLKKTAFKLFGGRKSICTLPSFFGGRSKSHGKGSSKKGIRKSKTHDCISEASWEDGRRTGDVPAGDFEYHGRKGSTAAKTLTSSQSAHAVHDPSKRPECGKADASLSPAAELCDRKLSTDKSLSFPRPKRGLKGLFSSIRRHKKNKAVDCEKSETSEPSVEDPASVCRSSASHRESKRPTSLTEGILPISLNGREVLLATPECTEDEYCLERGIPTTDADSDSSHQDQALKQAEGQIREETAEILNADGVTLGASSDANGAPPRNADDDLPSVHSSDQISSMFGDVASLKSFDSLTGCGDIIADQDDDSVAESTVSGERSRTAGKRSSCYVTYQGGGEEMATPDEVDEDYLQGLWENEAAADVCYTPSQQPSLMEADVDLQMTPESPVVPSPRLDTASNSGFLRAVKDTTSTTGDLLTPQSDQQESVPNSDEGYYDSTTPGPDDDGGDSLSRIRKEGLPRDSYSGDALYELYEPDDSLMSPPLGDESSFETQPPTPDSLEFLGLSLQSTDTKLRPGFPHQTGLMETEEARLAKIQKEILCRELQGMKKPSFKEQVAMNKARYYAEKSVIECIPKLNKKYPVCLKEEEEEVVPQMGTRKGKGVLQESSSVKENNRNNQMPPYNGDPESQKANGKPLHDLNPGDALPGTHASRNLPQLKEPLLYADQGSRRPVQSENKDKIYPSSKMKTEIEHDQAVCFSQALVDFTKHAKFFSHLSEGLGGSDSGSSFTQNMQALPAMVTFDVVDMENEGECDRQIDMGTDEDIASPFESYDESYLQKDAFAECDERMFEFYDQSSFVHNSWGVASLPRHLSLSRVSPPMPAPLSLNRRSKSLDTDSLEFEVGDVYVAQPKGSPQLNILSRSERESRKATALHWSSDCKRTGQSAGAGVRENTSSGAWKPEPACSFTLPLAEGKRMGQTQGFGSTEAAVPGSGPSAGQSPNWKMRPQVSKRLSQEKGSCNPILQAPRHMARPSHLPLQSGDRPSQSNSTGSSREPLCRNRAPVAPLDDRDEAYFARKPPGNQYSDPAHQHPKVKPVGVTQGVPHFRSDTSDPLKPAVEQQRFASKGRRELEMAPAIGCGKRTA